MNSELKEGRRIKHDRGGAEARRSTRRFAAGKVFKALPLLLGSWNSAAAEPLTEDERAMLQIYGNQEMISIATGTSHTIGKAPAVASVITAADIKAMGATDLDEVLETVPGVHVSRLAQNYASTYQIRGINGNPINPQVLMLQNGIPTNSLYRGDKGQTWGGLPLENIARIEIIRGPGSALYGADAFSGVINIITKQAKDTPGAEVGVRAGSFDTSDGWAQFGGKLGEIDVAAYLRVGNTDGFKNVIDADAATRLDKIFGTRASLAPGPVNTGRDALDASLDLGYGKWRLRGGYKLRDNLETGAGVVAALDPVGRETSERITADLSWIDPQIAQNWGMGMTGSFLHYSEDATHYQMFPPGTRFPTGTFPEGMIGSPGRWEQHWRLSGYVTYSGFTGHSLRLGLGHDDLNLYKTRTTKNFLLNPAGLPVPTGPVTNYNDIQPHILPHMRTNNYIYAQDEWHFARDWMLTAGIRHDRFSDFGSTTNPRLALVWDATLDLTAKLLYGQAFRAPAFGEQYGINPVANGNPNVKPENIRTLEAAFSWQARTDTQVNLSLFHYTITDTIRAAPNAGGVGATYTNTGRQTGYGGELEAQWKALDTLTLVGNYAYQKSTDETTHHDAGYAPHHQVYLRANWEFLPDWQFVPQAKWIIDRERSAGDNRAALPDYTWVDLTLRRKNILDHVELAFSVRNLFDVDAREPATEAIPHDLPLAGRSFYGEIRLNY